ncbi:hypothetical protein WJX73_004481 [Symbiochloris irregularis]|uniref:HVA22-like protein n=1 Tax=Symbiochloris irregularis TaxID=706552 RepID=A0AAW1PFT5_9CHLO
MAVIPVASSVGLQLLLQPATSGAIAQGACAGLGVLYPAYATFKAVETTKQDPVEANKQLSQWVTYWTIFGGVSVVEGLFSKKPPGYHHVKLLFLLWLQSSSYQGARRLYLNHARPFLLKHEHQADHLLGQIQNFMARPELAWMADHFHRFAAQVPGLEWLPWV